MGIGEAMALKLAEQGVNVALVSRSKVRSSPIYCACIQILTLRQDKLEAVRSKIEEKKFGVKVRVYAVDLQNFTDVDRAVDQAVSELGQIDILVNNVSYFVVIPREYSYVKRKH